MSRTIISSYRSVSGGRIIGDFRNVTLIMSVVQLSYLLAGRNSWSHEESCTIKKNPRRSWKTSVRPFLWCPRSSPT